MADIDVNIYQSVTNRNGVSTPVSGVINGDPLPDPVNPSNGNFTGIGITLNRQVIGGVKRLIESSDILNIPSYWEYNVFSLDINAGGQINIDSNGMLNILDLERILSS
jgi:hypothetical protein